MSKFTEVLKQKKLKKEQLSPAIIKSINDYDKATLTLSELRNELKSNDLSPNKRKNIEKSITSTETIMDQYDENLCAKIKNFDPVKYQANAERARKMASDRIANKSSASPAVVKEEKKETTPTVETKSDKVELAVPVVEQPNQETLKENIPVAAPVVNINTNNKPKQQSAQASNVKKKTDQPAEQSTQKNEVKDESKEESKSKSNWIKWTAGVIVSAAAVYFGFAWNKGLPPFRIKK